jgi:hypothetical protein
MRFVPSKAQAGDRGNVVMKVNGEVFDFACELSQVGIPVFAGVPLVSSLIQLARMLECNWYCLIGSYRTCVDREVECDTGTNLTDGTIRGPLRQDEVVDIVEARSQTTEWRALLEKLQSIRKEEELGGYHFRFGPVYKPVYFMFW